MVVMMVAVMSFIVTSTTPKHSVHLVHDEHAQ